MSESGDIAIDMAGGVATLRLRNPARRNAVSAAMWRAIHAFASEVGRRDDVRAVVIRGDGDKAPISRARAAAPPMRALTTIWSRTAAS